MRLPEKILLIVFFVASSIAIYAQPKFKVKIYPSQIRQGELATLKFTIEDFQDARKFSFPVIEGLKVINGPENHSESVTVNGIQKSYSEIIFVVRAESPGYYNFSNTTCIVDGEQMKCRPATLTVLNNNDFNSELYKEQCIKNIGDADNRVKEKMHLKLSLSKNTCFVGEPVVATYRLYSRLNSDCKLVKNPSFNGFSVIEMQSPDVTENYFENINGKKYNVYVIRRSQLFPLTAGRMEIDSMTVDGDVNFVNTSDNYNLFSHAINLNSGTGELIVKPLPANKPDGFNGAVGNFNISSSLEKDEIPVNTTGKYILKISGSGNFQMLTAPVISWPQGFESFTPMVVDNIEKESFPTTGSKIFEYNFNLKKEGRFTIPPVKFSFFDPENNRYKTVYSEPVILQVSSPAETASSIISVPKKSKTEFPRELIILGFATIAISSIIIFVVKRKKTEVIADTKDEEIIQDNVEYFTASEKCLEENDCKNFYFKLNCDLKNFAVSKFKIKGKDEILDCENNICRSVIERFYNLINEVEQKSFTPQPQSGNDAKIAMNDMLVRSKEMVYLIKSYDVLNSQ